MKYYIDTEFNAFNGELLTLALVASGGQRAELYLARNDIDTLSVHPWVRDNVLDIIVAPDAIPHFAKLEEFPLLIRKYLGADNDPVIVADWPDDLRYFMQCLITGPGMMISLPSLKTELRRVDSYPTKLAGAVQHNALWDARALRTRCEE